LDTTHPEACIAPLDDAEIRLLRSRRPGLLLLLMLAVDAMMIAGAVVFVFTDPDFLTFWAAIAMVPVALLLALITLHAEDEWRLLRKDLEASVKVYRNGRIGSVSMQNDGESPPTYRIGVVFGDPESSVGFSIPEELYEAVSEGQAARIACTPLSLVLLELRTDDYVYIATNP
jgi:hypothetical protein